jgi:hypothetical protein
MFPRLEKRKIYVCGTIFQENPQCLHVEGGLSEENFEIM